MEEEIVCPECGSTNILYSNKRRLHICEDCAHQFTPNRAKPKRRIFISYGHDPHAAFAVRLKKDLEALGYDAWFDIDRIKGGGDWERYIEEGLEWVSAYQSEGRFVLLMTPHSVRKPDGYCLNELARALQRRLHIIPVMVLDSDMPASIQHLGWLDMRDYVHTGEKAELYSAGLQLLINAIEKNEMPQNTVDIRRTPKEETKPTSLDNVQKPERIYIGNGVAEHESLAVQLKKDLEARGLAVWFDPASLKNDHEAYVEDGLSWAAGVPEKGRYILLMTPHTVRRPSGVCLNELARARKKNLPVIPVMVSWCEPPLSICRTQWLDMRDCVPVEHKQEKYKVRLCQLFEVLDTGKLDQEGVQSRLLHILEPLQFDADIVQHVLKFKGRKQILERVYEWLDDAKAPRVLWLSGMPGSGKSAIAAWLAYHRPEVAAYHMCKHDDAGRSDTRHYIQSIAYQLSTQIPEYQAALNTLNLENIIKEPNAARLFDELIVRPLAGVSPKSSRPVLVVLDSLDEAGGRVNELASLMTSEFLKTPPWLRLLITSRPDPAIVDTLKNIGPLVIDISSHESEQDVRLYVRDELYKKFPGPEPLVDNAIHSIVAKSEGNMLYAEYICREILSGRIQLGSLDEFPKGLGGAYAEFFTRQFPDIDAYKAGFRPVLEMIVAAREPLPVTMIGQVLGKDAGEMKKLCDSMGSIFPVTHGLIRPFHGSLKDWLIYSDRAGQYFVSLSKGHRRLAEYGMGEYRAGVGSMSLYMLAWLPEHLAKAERWDELRMIVSDPAYVSRLEDTKVKKISDLATYHEALEARSNTGNSKIS